MLESKIAKIDEKHLKAIRDLEKKIGTDICLVAIEKKAGTLYALEAKTAPNVWERVDKIYPEIEGLKAYYKSQEDAHHAKASLKSLLNSKKYKAIKKPIRMRKVSR